MSLGNQAQKWREELEDGENRMFPWAWACLDPGIWWDLPIQAGCLSQPLNPFPKHHP